MNKFTTKLSRSSPVILTCLSVAGLVGTAITAVRATPKALERIEREKIEVDDELSLTEIIMTTWQCYIPSVLLGLGTAICIFGIGSLDKLNQASLASAYAVLNESYKQYRKSAKSVYGNDADEKIHAEMAKDAEIYVENWGSMTYSMEMDPKSERVLCYDMISQRYFNTTMAAIINAQYHLNRNLHLRGFCPLNEYYDFLGLERTEAGNDIGWDWEKLADDMEEPWIDFDNHRTIMDDGMECIVISGTEPAEFSQEVLDYCT